MSKILSTVDLEKTDLQLGEEREATSIHFRLAKVCRSLSTIDPEKTESVEEREGNLTHFRSTRMFRSLPVTNLNKTDIHSRGEKVIPRAFDRWVCTDHSWFFDLTKKNSIRGETGELDSLSIDWIIQNIVDHWSTKEKFIQRETRKLYSLSIDGIVQIIVDHGSRKDRDSFAKENGTWLDPNRNWSCGCWVQLSDR